MALKEIDVAVIQMIQQAELQSLATLKNNIAQQAASFDFINWIEQFCKLGLLNVQPLGEI
ncbi:hypothetical protein L4C33_19875 [Vibrio makurazakiensis]|uniref:hypothetical protein n=1 Tax=Vibrio makurazakiensis TaxID=2910250 RepID=UPI003D0BA5A6